MLGFLCLNLHQEKLYSDMAVALEPKENNDNQSQQLEYWRGLAQIARDEKLDELEVESNGVRVALRTSSSAASGPVLSTAIPVGIAAPGFVAQPVAVPSASLSALGAEPCLTARDESLTEIHSPMVGVFYRAPSPSDPNFVEIGDKVEVGQTVALVEAMKVFNEITAEVAGIVVEVKSESGDLVETGQVLVTIRPA